jgi:hypothetical protein
MIGTQYHNGVPYHPSVPKKVWRKVRKTLLIDSRDRQITHDTHPGSYTVTLPTVYQNIYAASLRSIELPLSFYTFSACAKNTTMNVTFGASSATITIPDGNYDYVNNLMLPVIVDAINTQFNIKTFAGTYSAITGKITFSAGVPFSFNFTKTPPADSSCSTAVPFSYSKGWGLGYYLGFLQTVRVATQTTGSQTYTLISDFVSNLQPDTSILMEIANLNKNDESSLDDRRNGVIDGSFAKIPIDGNSGDYIFLQDTGTYPLNRHIYQPPVGKINTLQIKFRFHDGRVVNFNNVEHTFTLELELLDNNFDEFSGVEFGV